MGDCVMEAGIPLRRNLGTAISERRNRSMDISL
jgi:hypothetical protein